jgi:hypothetical protein
MLSLLTDDAVFPHPGAKCAGIETKKSRCSVFSFDSPAGFLQNLNDVVVFQIDKGFDVLTSRLICIVGRIEVVQYL